MTTLGLALSGLRHRTGAFAATFVSAALGGTLLMTFASLLDTAAGASAADRDGLVTTASVAGGWCLLIVVFAVGSTMSLSVRQRAAEMRALHDAGATRGQVGRMIVGEAVLVALVAAAVAVPAATLLGGVLLDLLRDTGQVGAAVPHRFGPIALGTGFGAGALGSAAGAVLAARRSGRAGPAEGARPGRGRLAAALVLLLAGTACGVVTATVMHGKGIDAMQTGGQAAIWFSLGLALLAPWLLRAAAVVLARPARRLAGPAGELAVLNLRQRSVQLAGAVMPVILFTGIATGTVYLQAIEDDAAAGQAPDEIARMIETLNYTVIGMITLFVAIMLVNTTLAATAHRRPEFARQRLAGATRAQVLGTVLTESALLTVTGVVCGSLASLVTIVPYGIARADRVVPRLDAAPWAVIAAVAALLTVVTAVAAARRAVRGAAVTALAGTRG